MGGCGGGRYKGRVSSYGRVMSVTRRLSEWRNDQWSATLESLNPEDQSPWKLTKRVMRVPTPSPPLVTLGGLALSDSEKAEALADSLKAQFQPVTVPSFPAVIEMVDVALESYLQTPANEPKLTNPDEVREAIRGLKVARLRDLTVFRTGP